MAVVVEYILLKCLNGLQHGVTLKNENEVPATPTSKSLSGQKVDPVIPYMISH